MPDINTSVADFEDADDRPFEGELPHPQFAEAQMWNFSDGNYGVVYHVGSMPGDMKLWDSVFSINCPDGSVLVAKVIGRSTEETMFGSPGACSHTIEPYKSWRITFDGAMRRYSQEELAHGPGTDGAHVPVRLELDVRASHPTWEPGERGHGEEIEGSVFDTMCQLHIEQPLTATGTIVIDGQCLPYSAIGHRDHSRGPRDFRTLLRGNWFNVTFDSGWAFLGFYGENDTGVHERSAIYEGGRIYRGSMEHDGEIETTGPEPRQFRIAVKLEDGRTRTMKVTVKQVANWFSPGGSEWCIGSDTSHPENYIWTMSFCQYECDGERGVGFADRGGQVQRLTALPGRGAS